MGRNMAKSFANMRLLYWKPTFGGSGVTYDEPVVFKGKYIGNSAIGDGSPNDSAMFSSSGVRENLVLFYMLEPEVDGYVCWDTTYENLADEGLLNVHPSEIPQTHKIKSVVVYVMPDAKVATLQNKAFIAQVA